MAMMKQAFDVASKAVAAQESGKYGQSFRGYMDAIELFVKAQIDIKDPRSKELVKQRCIDFLQKAENVYRHWQDQRQRKKDALKLEERLESLKSDKKSEPVDNTPEGLRRRLDALHGPGHREQREREEAAKREWLLGMQSKHITNPVDQTEQILETALEAHELAKQSKNAALKLQMTNMGIDPQSLLTEAKTVQDDVANSATSDISSASAAAAPRKSAVDELIEKTKMQMLIPPAHGLDVDELNSFSDDEDDVEDVVKMAHDLIKYDSEPTSSEVNQHHDKKKKKKNRNPKPDSTSDSESTDDDKW